ncbi:hypothetical protein Salat_0150700 [Sesamum alatum]|uniref:Uncharacterized protein n=1 Tax=Sesamum alatum TaxID=300844 RepID=A0AAE1YWN6_9LAMI|nr:hypothetical protein Salat_0150700 [Sesamum alatum]
MKSDWNLLWCQDIEQGTGSKFTVEEIIDLLIASYSSSDTCKKMKTLVAEIRRTLNREEGELRLAIYVADPRSHDTSNRMQVIITFMSNPSRSGRPRSGLPRPSVALGFGLGSVFYNVRSSYNSIHARGSLLMFVASLSTMMAIGGFRSFVEELKRNDDRGNNHDEFPSWPDSWSRCSRPNDAKRLILPVAEGPTHGLLEVPDVLHRLPQVEVGIDLAVLFGMVVVYRVLFFVIVKIGEKIKSAVAAKDC